MYYKSLYLDIDLIKSIISDIQSRFCFTMKLCYQLEEAKSICTGELAIFAKENGLGGKRYYLVGSYSSIKYLPE